MENKTKILTFAAVALMFAVCFIGFVAINDDAVDADGTTTNVAKIGDTEYPTLAEAVDVATDGVTITLLSNITVDKRIDVDKNVTFNLNGYNITGNDVTAFGICGGNVILDGVGTITSTHVSNLKQDNCIIQVYDRDGKEGVSLTIEENVIIKTNYCYGVAIYGHNNVRTELIIKGEVTTEERPAVSGNGTEIYGGTSIVISESATVKTTKTNAIYHPQKGTLNINGTVDGGFEIKSGSTAVIGENAIVKANGQGPSHTASSNGTSTNGYAIAVVENSAYAGSPTVTIGEKSTIIGTINIFVDDKVAEGKKGKIVVNGGSFTDIANAVKYATSGAAITLADDVEIPGVILVEKKITLDLNGHNIVFSSKARFLIKGGDLSIIGTGTISEIEPYYAPIMLNGSTGNTPNYSVVTVGKDVTLIGWSGIFFNQTTDNGAPSNYGMVANLYGTIKYEKDTNNDTGAGIYVNGTIGSKLFDANNRYPVINIYDTAKISGEGLGIYAAGYARWFIDGANIEGTQAAIEIRAGELTIKDGSFKSTATEFSCDPNGNGSTTTGAAIAIAQHTTKRDITVNISGGTFEGLRALNESNPQNNDPVPKVNLSVTGGTFKGMIQSVDSIDFITGGSFSDLSGLAYVASGVTYNLVNDCTVDSDITVKAGTTLSIAKGATLTTKGTITNKGVIDNKGTVINEGVITTVAGGINISGKLIMGDGSKLIVGGKDIIDGLKIEDGAILAINTNSKGGFDATLNGKATASKLDVSINDTFTVAKGAELTMTGTFLNAGNVTIDGTLLMTDAGKLQVMKNGIVTINGTIDGGIIDITDVKKDIVCVLFKPNSTITSKIDGTDGEKVSIVVLFGIKAGKGGVSVTKGSVIVDGALVEGDVTVPSGSTSFVYGTLEPGATLTIENNAAVNPTGSGSLVVESGAKVVTNSGASIKSVTYKAGSELNGTTFDTDTRVTPEGNVLVAIKIYLNYDNKKLNVSADYVEAFAGDKYVDVLSGVSVSGVNSRITFSGWYNSLDEKITSDVVVPSGGADVILTAHFTEKAKNTVINTGSNDGVDYSVVIAFIVLIGSIVFLCSVLRKR